LFDNKLLEASIHYHHQHQYKLLHYSASPSISFIPPMAVTTFSMND
jgi:hypothetical protein